MEELQNGDSQTHRHQSDNPLEPSSSHDDFLEQMLSSLSNCTWPDLSNPNPNHNSIKSHDDSVDDARSDYPVTFPSFDDLTSKLRLHVNANNSASMAALLQQQLLPSRGVAAAESCLVPLPLSLAGADSLDSRLHDMGADGSVQALFSAFLGPLHGDGGHTTSISPFQAGVEMPAQSFGAPGQAPASASTGGSGQAPQRQRVRARRGQATDPHSIAERLRRERIAERMKALQELVPNGNKTDKASMLDEIIDYVKFLQLQVKVLSMSRLGGASAAAPRVADLSSEVGRSSTDGNPVGASNNGMSIAEHQVVKLMEEDMGSAMQYLQGKGLCLMPISLATAISTATHNTRNSGGLSNNNHRQHHPPSPPSDIPTLIGNGKGGGNGRPSSPELSGLTVQSPNLANGDGYTKDSIPPSQA